MTLDSPGGCPSGAAGALQASLLDAPASANHGDVSSFLKASHASLLSSCADCRVHNPRTCRGSAQLLLWLLRGWERSPRACWQVLAHAHTACLPRAEQQGLPVSKHSAWQGEPGVHRGAQCLLRERCRRQALWAGTALPQKQHAPAEHPERHRGKPCPAQRGLLKAVRFEPRVKEESKAGRGLSHRVKALAKPRRQRRPSQTAR